jgi:hypothetical protein
MFLDLEKTMQVNIKAKGMTLQTQHIAYIERRMGYAFARLKSDISKINILLSTSGKSNDEIENVCEVSLTLNCKKKFVIKESKSELIYAIDRAIHRASHASEQYIRRKKLSKKYAYSKVFKLSDYKSELVQI